MTFDQPGTLGFDLDENLDSQVYLLWGTFMHNKCHSSRLIVCLNCACILTGAVTS